MRKLFLLFVVSVAALLAAAAALAGGTRSAAFVTPAESAALQTTTGFSSLSQPATLAVLGPRVAAYERVPTKLLVTTPVTQKATPGKRIAQLVCGVPVCTEIANAVDQAAKAIGWKTIRVNLGVSPQEFAAAYTQAIALKPDLVIGSGLSRAFFNKQLLELQKLKIPVLMFAGPDGPGNGITWNMLDAPTYWAAGQMLSEFIANDSKLKGHVVMFNVAQYAGSTHLADMINKYFPKVCPTCTLSYQLAQVTAIGQLGQKVTGFVQAHPETNYVICTFGDLCQGVGQALKAAGRGDVKVITKDPATTNYANIAGGVESATVPLNSPQTGWQIIDAAQRIFNHQPLPPTRLLPQQIVTKIADPKSQVIGAVPNYQAQYLKLWKVKG